MLKKLNRMTVGEVARFEDYTGNFITVTRNPGNSYTARIGQRQSIYYHVEALASCMERDGIIYRKGGAICTSYQNG